MVSSTLTAQPPSNDAVRMNPARMDNLNVTHTLMGVSPAETKAVSHCKASLDSYAGLESLAEQAHAMHHQSSSPSVANPSTAPSTTHSTPVANPAEDKPVESARAAPSTGLDALAALASEEANGNSDKTLEPFLTARTGLLASAPNSSDEDEASSDRQMPPPPPRRQRSASNPEGMEKWDSLNRARGRRHFVLPEAILEEELAEANAAVRERELKKSEDAQRAPPVMAARRAVDETEPADEEDDDEIEEEKLDEDEEEEEVDESMLTPEELLRKARSRLLEDLSEGSINGEKGQLMLPHALGKYKHVYNKNGRIGIYTPAERAAIIAKFNAKRQRRVWNKKIRYNCRKSLADRRLRVKGRFVKRSEQEQLKRELQARVEQKVEEETNTTSPDNEEEKDKDTDMPDVTDPEAGFVPTEDQPYRRLRRYTIT